MRPSTRAQPAGAVQHFGGVESLSAGGVFDLLAAADSCGDVFQQSDVLTRDDSI